jgi:disulfide oxidoreductase YuzD
MSPKDSVTVRVLDLPGAGGVCPCSDPTLSPEYAAMLQQKVSELKTALEENYPGRTAVEYVNLCQVPAEQESEPGRLLAGKQYPPPLVVINGEVKFAGTIQVDKIVQEVDRILAARD